MIEQLRADYLWWSELLASIDREREGILAEYHRSFNALIEAQVAARGEGHDRTPYG
jgi:hypothetical protein